MPVYLTRIELANALKVSRATIKQYEKRGIITPIRIGGIVRFNADQVRGEIEKRQPALAV